MRLYNLIKRVIQAIFHWLNQIYQGLRVFPNRVTRNSEYNRELTLIRKQEELVLNLQENLVNLRQEIASAIDSQKFLERQYLEVQSQADEWQQRAEEARQLEDEQLTSEVLSYQQRYADNAIEWKAKLEELTALIAFLKRDLVAKESELSEARIKADMLKPRTQAAKAQKLLAQKQKCKKRGSNSTSRFAYPQDSEYLQEQHIMDMQEELVVLRQAVTIAIAELKHIQRHYEQVQAEVNTWQEKVQMFIQQGNEASAHECLSRKKTSDDFAIELKAKLEEQTALVNKLKRNLIDQEFMVSKAKNEQAIRVIHKLIERLKDPQEDLEVLRQAVKKAIATKKRIEKQYADVQAEIDKWQQNVEQARQRGDETLVSEVLRRQKDFVDTAMELKVMLDDVTPLVDTLKQDLIKITQNRSSEL